MCALAHFKASRLPRRVPGLVANKSAEGDVVLLRNKQQSIHEGNLVKLDPSKKTETHKGAISHAEIIGKEPRQVVQSSKGVAYRIHEPTLAEYVRLTPRLVTPVRLPQLVAAPCRVKELG